MTVQSLLKPTRTALPSQRAASVERPIIPSGVSVVQYALSLTSKASAVSSAANLINTSPPPAIPPDEFVNWRDNGCPLHPKCLECPEECCFLEKTNTVKQFIFLSLCRVARELKKLGCTRAEIAVKLGCDYRSTYRYLPKRKRRK
jgi:hypothetical protein